MVKRKLVVAENPARTLGSSTCADIHGKYCGIVVLFVRMTIINIGSIRSTINYSGALPLAQGIKFSA